MYIVAVSMFTYYLIVPIIVYCINKKITMFNLILFPFKLIFAWLYFIYGKIFWINNFYIISKNIATIYNTVKSSKHNSILEFSSNEKCSIFLALLWDAIKYINLWQVSIEEIYHITLEASSLENAIPELIKVLLSVDASPSQVYTAFNWPYRIKINKFIEKWINKSYRYNHKYEDLIIIIISDSVIREYLNKLLK